ncbi:GNAT family N-acetyltransferase [Aerococcaceae bacterium NML210727]|nr:GNAT family N-acetyltransferase [Aerococcaceae bacterium NML210727]MCW6654996.1 GNAT family N-acetyltransferase [Aerococcaceae bacterium NML201296]
MEVKIRQVEVSDAEQLLHYIQQVGAESDNLLFGTEDLSLTVAEIMTMITAVKKSTNSNLLVAEVDGQLIGSAQLAGNKRTRTKHRASLAVSVLKSHWHQGVASQLLSQLIAAARKLGIEQIVLEVRSDNQAAIALYRKFGFSHFGTLPRYFKIGTAYYDADYMHLNLN